MYYAVYKMKDFNEPMDGIVYGVCASLGFATLENIYYVYVLADYFDYNPNVFGWHKSFYSYSLAHAILEFLWDIFL